MRTKRARPQRELRRTLLDGTTSCQSCSSCSKHSARAVRSVCLSLNPDLLGTHAHRPLGKAVDEARAKGKERKERAKQRGEEE